MTPLRRHLAARCSLLAFSAAIFCGAAPPASAGPEASKSEAARPKEVVEGPGKDGGAVWRDGDSRRSMTIFLDSLDALEKKDHPAWLRMTRTLAGRGDAQAMNTLGNAALEGTGVPKDAAEAARWFQKAAAAGDGNAMYSLGSMHVREAGGLKKDPKETARLYAEASDKGHILASYDFGTMLWSGEGVKQDREAGKAYMERAAEGGFGRAQYNLGMFLLDEAAGFKNPAEAAKWLRAAADQKVVEAQNNLGTLYCKGIGVPKDRVECLKWLILAADGGHADAAKNRDSIARAASADEARRAKEAAAAWTPPKREE